MSDSASISTDSFTLIEGFELIPRICVTIPFVGKRCTPSVRIPTVNVVPTSNTAGPARNENTVETVVLGDLIAIFPWQLESFNTVTGSTLIPSPLILNPEYQPVAVITAPAEPNIAAPIDEGFPAGMNARCPATATTSLGNTHGTSAMV